MTKTLEKRLQKRPNSAKLEFIHCTKCNYTHFIDNKKSHYLGESYKNASRCIRCGNDTFSPGSTIEEGFCVTVNGRYNPKIIY